MLQMLLLCRILIKPENDFISDNRLVMGCRVTSVAFGLNPGGVIGTDPTPRARYGGVYIADGTLALPHGSKQAATFRRLCAPVLVDGGSRPLTNLDLTNLDLTNLDSAPAMGWAGPSDCLRRHVTPALFLMSYS